MYTAMRENNWNVLALGFVIWNLMFFITFYQIASEPGLIEN